MANRSAADLLAFHAAITEIRDFYLTQSVEHRDDPHLGSLYSILTTTLTHTLERHDPHRTAAQRSRIRPLSRSDTSASGSD